MTAFMSGFEYTEIRFDAAGRPLDPAGRAAALRVIARSAATDVLLLAHGWNNDLAGARTFFDAFAAALREELPVPGPAGRRLALVGLVWPSRRFPIDTDDRLADDSGAPPRRRAGRETRGAGPVEVRAAVAGLSAALETGAADPAGLAGLAGLGGTVDALERSPAARGEFVAGVASAVRSAAAGLAGAGVEPDEGTSALLASDPEALVGGLSADVRRPPAGSDPAAGWNAVPGRYGRAAVRLLNIAGYAAIRDRSAVVGAHGAAPVLVELGAARPDLRLHLVGHSFGGRLVSAAATELAGHPAARVQTLTLLQAAFSHYGFAPRWDGRHDGVFRPLVSGPGVTGPVLVTHTANDRVVGYPYAVVSLALRHAGVALGDPGSRWGAIGCNGARRTPEADDGVLLGAGTSYRWRAGRVHNLRADLIAGHSDVARPEVARAVLHAIGST